MPPHALIISHGQPSDPAVGEAEIARLAQEVNDHLPDWHITGASLSSEGTLEAAARAVPDGALVYPMFMADGWFTQTVLPRRLAGTNLRILPPFGTDPGLVAVATREIRRQGAPNNKVFLAGHGSGKSPKPAKVTRDFAQSLAAELNTDVRCGFVEEAPFLADVAKGLAKGAVCLPFFATRRGHVLDDIPAALDEADFQGPLLDPIGCLAEIPAFIAASLRRAV